MSLNSQERKTIIGILFVWIVVAIWFNIPSLDWTIGPFHSKDKSLLIPSIYGLLINAAIYFGNIYYLIPRFLKSRRFGRYITLLGVYFLGICILETALDLLVYHLIYGSLDNVVIEDASITNFLLNALFFLFPSFLHRFAMDWFSKEETEPERKEEDLLWSIKSGTETHRIPINQINYIESDGNYIKYFLDDRFIMARDSLSKVEKQLPQNTFVRSHKSFLVRIKAIEKATYNSIKIKDVSIPIGRVYKENINSAINDL